MLALTGLVFLVVVLATLVPNRSGSGRSVIPRAPAFGAEPTTAGATFQSTRAEERAARRAEAVVRPLARTFVDDLALRRNLPQAYALLDSRLRGSYSLADWKQDRGIPLVRTGARGGVSVAFAGATTVGVVADLDANRLFAVRFEKQHGRWLVDYVHAGRSSTYVSSSNFAPAGFVPGSRHETMWTWLALGAILVGGIAVAVLAERRFG